MNKPVPLPDDYATIAGMSDEAVSAKTGRTWPEWVAVLDGIGAAAMAHRDIARHLHQELDVADWWAQMVTVGYERLRGLREVGQRRGGLFEASRSRTFPVPVATLYAACAGEASLDGWLPAGKYTLRKTTPNRSVRIAWNDGTAVEMYFTDKGPAKSAVAIQHRKLPNQEAIARSKDMWGARLDALGEIVSSWPDSLSSGPHA